MYILTSTIIDTNTSVFRCEMMPMSFTSKEETEDFITYGKTSYDTKCSEDCISYYIKEGSITYIHKLWLKTIEY